MIDNIQDGRNRAMEILSLINPSDYEVLYGERHGGIGYCPFKYTMDKINWKGASVRTNKSDYIKLDPTFLLTNRDRCETHDIDHELILAFNWKTKCRSIFIVPDALIEDTRTSTTQNYWIFKEDNLDLEAHNGITKLV